MTLATTKTPAMTGTAVRADSVGTYVQYGCGLCSPAGWINFDASPTLRMQRVPILKSVAPGVKFPASARYGDIIKGLPLPDSTCDAVYCSHVLEHLSQDDAILALANTFRLLKPGGTFRFVLPDLRHMAERYVASRSPEAASDFLGGMILGERRRNRGIKGLVRNWAGNSDHRWMWDYESMENELSKAGFSDIRRAAFGDSGDPMFEAVEAPDRWDNCLGVQCKRPLAR